MPSFSRVIFLLHRYFGIGLGIVVTLWCLSGFVMMYVPYPEVSIEDNLKASPHLNLSGCCQVPGLDEFSDIRLNGANPTVPSFTVVDASVAYELNDATLLTLKVDNLFDRLYASTCLLYTSPSPRDQRGSRMPSSA